jgi:hypothetical protein
MRDRRVVKAEACFRLSEVPPDDIGELFRINVDIVLEARSADLDANICHYKVR